MKIHDHTGRRCLTEFDHVPDINGEHDKEAFVIFSAGPSAPLAAILTFPLAIPRRLT